jgi:AcrR family transcriptional regulator
VEDEELSLDPHPQLAGPRQRSGATKRLRTQLQLNIAGRKLFAERGWHGTRMEDVAQEAGVSLKTLYKHYPSKHALIARVYGGTFSVMIEDGQHLLDETEDVRQVLEWMFAKLVETSINRRNLTAAMIAALLEQPLIYPEPTADQLPEDFGVASIVAAISDLIEIGQEDGLLNPNLPAFKVASYHVTETLLFITMNAEAAIDEVQQLVLTQVMPALSASAQTASARD